MMFTEWGHNDLRWKSFQAKLESQLGCNGDDLSNLTSDGLQLVVEGV